MARKKKPVNKERTRAAKMVMDLFYAMRHIKGTPSITDLLFLAKRIKGR